MSSNNKLNVNGRAPRIQERESHMMPVAATFKMGDHDRTQNKGGGVASMKKASLRKVSRSPKN